MSAFLSIGQVARLARIRPSAIRYYEEAGLLEQPDRVGGKCRYEEGRIFLTRNHRDFIEFTFEFYRAGEAHPGVLLVRRNLPNDRPARIAHSLKRWADARTDMPATFDGVDSL